MKEVEVAILAAREVGQLMLDWRKDFPPGPARMEYKDAKDVVTEVDTRSEEIIVNHIRQHFPDHHILAEERGEEAGAADSPYTWVIDPLDGTANYAADLATSCVSIALAKEDEVIMGVVYNPFRDEMFVAEKGRGTLLNDRPIRVFPTEKLEKALVCFDLGYNEEKAVEQLRQAMFFVLGLVSVAVGRFDLFYHQALKPWDLAAALVILQEAGAVVTQNDGQPANYLKPSVIAASPLVYREFMEALDIYHKTK